MSRPNLTVATLVRRAVTTHRGAVVLLAVVVAVGAFLGAAGPRWANDRLDETLREVITDAGSRSELTMRTGMVPYPAAMTAEVPTLRSTAGADLQGVLGPERWAAATTPGTVQAQNGVPIDDGNYPRVASVRAPDDLASRVRLLEGTLPEIVDPVPYPAALVDLPIPIPFNGNLAIVDVVATPAVAEAMRIEVGDVVVFEHKSRDSTAYLQVDGGRLPVGARLTGLVEPVDPADLTWRDAGTAIEPDLGAPATEPRITSAVLLTDPGLLTDWIAATEIYLDAEWHVALLADEVAADEVDAIVADLRRLGASTTWESGLTTLLGTYTERRAAAEGAVAFGVVSLAALCAALILLSARMIADRRSEEVALARTRGAGDGALARLLTLDAAAVAVPAVAVGTLAANLLVPGRATTLSWLVPAVLALGAVVAVPALAIRQAHLSGPTGGDRPDVVALRPSPRRLVLELGVLLLAAAGLWLTATREPEAGVDLVVSLAPIVAAAAAGLVIFRVVPILVAAVLPWLRRRRGLTSFLAVTRSARAPAHAVLPVIALLVAIGVVAFGGTVRASVDHARQVASWTTTAGDALVQSGVIRNAPEDIAAAPGVDDVAFGHFLLSQRPRNLDTGRVAGVDVLAVDTDAWSDVVADAPEPVDPVPALTAPTASGDVPAVIQGNVDVVDVGDRLELTIRGHTVVVEVVQKLAAVPGTGSNPTLVLPSQPLVEADVPLGPPNVAYFSGDDLTTTGLAQALGIDPSEVMLREAALTTIEEDPILSTVMDAFRLVGWLAAILAAAAAVVGLAVGERTRAYGLSILRTLGLTTRQTATLTAADVVPTSIVAAIAGVGVGTGVGILTTKALDLSALSGVIAGDTRVVADVPGATQAAAIVLAVVLVAVVVTVVVNRRAKLGSVLRAGENA